MTIDNRLNNIFDQYDQEENRVTNAFLQTISKDKRLLKTFLLEYFDIRLAENSNVIISSQKVPFGLGDKKEDREKAEGIPDGWIIIDEEIALVFEAKIKRDMIKDNNQLLAHAKRIKGYGQKYLGVITPDEESPIKNISILNVNVKWLSWRDVYKIVSSGKGHQDLSGYLRNQLKEYLAMKEDLVGFQGIDYPSGLYNSREAKIIIKNLIGEIKPEILKGYPNLKFERKSYSKDVHPYKVFHRSVWSCLAADKNFTKDLHVTFWVAETHFGMGITIPHNAGKRWTRLREIFSKDDPFDSFVSKLYQLREKLPNLYIEFVHRHYIGRKGNDIIDGILEMDIDTIKGSENVKANENWLEALRNLVKSKKGYNGQLMLITRFFYKDDPKIKTMAFKDEIIKTANNFKDIYDFLCLK